jgi:hypothetical protein
MAGMAEGLGAGAGNAGAVMYQNILATRRNKLAQDAAAKNQLVNDRNTQLAKMTPERTQAVGPEAMKAEFDSFMSNLPEELRATMPNFAGMDSSVAQRSAPARRRVLDATAPSAVPADLSLEGLLKENRVDPATSEEGFNQLSALSSEAGIKRGALRRELPREAVKDIDPTGTERTRFMTEEEQGEVGPLQSGLTSDQNAARSGAQTKATEQAGQDVLNDPNNQKGRARGAGMEASARKNAELTAELNRMGITGQQQSAALALAGDFEKLSKDHFTVRTSFQNVAQLARQGTAASDMALIFNFMKMQDPGSTVREGEYANAQNAAGVPTRILNLYNRVKDGERLAPEQRSDFVNTAKTIYTTSKKDHDGVRQQFTQRAQGMRVPPSLVVRDVTEPENADPAGSILDMLRERRRP